MSQNYFALHPCDERIAIKPPLVDGWLVELGLARADGHLGERFGALIACEGDEPATVQRLIDSPDGSPLSNAFEATWLPAEDSEYPIVGPETEQPHCSCGAEVEEPWPDLISRWWEDRDARFDCRCGKSTRIPELNWHHTAGFAQTQVELPHDLAANLEPRPELLAELARRSGTPWTWTWIRR